MTLVGVRRESQAVRPDAYELVKLSRLKLRQQLRRERRTRKVEAAEAKRREENKREEAEAYRARVRKLKEERAARKAKWMAEISACAEGATSYDYATLKEDPLFSPGLVERHLGYKLDVSCLSLKSSSSAHSNGARDNAWDAAG